MTNVADKSYEPHPEQIALIPSTSGNTINGLGEMELRRPTTIYWDNPDTLPHGGLMKWYVRRNYQGDRLKTRRHAEEIEAAELEPVAEQAVDAPAPDWVAAVKKKAVDLGASQVGITPIDPLWVFDRYDVEFKWAIVLALPMDYALISTSPSGRALNEVLEKYNDIYIKSRQLSCPPITEPLVV
jgi:epoxyqueuosine reductase